MQLASVDAAGPDQTRVAKRSIGHENGQLVQPVVDDMVIAHLADSIGAALSTHGDSDNHVIWFQAGMLNCGVLRCPKRVEHVLVGIDPCGNRRQHGHDNS